jgi:hypothetical protein
MVTYIRLEQRPVLKKSKVKACRRKVRHISLAVRPPFSSLSNFEKKSSKLLGPETTFVVDCEAAASMFVHIQVSNVDPEEWIWQESREAAVRPDNMDGGGEK